MMTMMNKNMNQKCKVHRHYINECYRNLSNNCSTLFIIINILILCSSNELNTIYVFKC